MSEHQQCNKIQDVRTSTMQQNTRCQNTKYNIQKNCTLPNAAIFSTTGSSYNSISEQTLVKLMDIKLRSNKRKFNQCLSLYKT